MANYRSGNVHFVDTNGTLRDSRCKIVYIYLDGIGGSPGLDLTDTSGNTIWHMSLSGSGDARFLDFSTNPLMLPNGLAAANMTNVNVMIVYKEE